MFCQKCGNGLLTGDKFCKECGNPVSSTGSGMPQHGGQPQYMQTMGEGKRENMRLLSKILKVTGIIAFVVAVGFTIAGIYGFATLPPRPAPVGIGQIVGGVHQVGGASRARADAEDQAAMQIAISIPAIIVGIILIKVSRNLTKDVGK